MYDFHTGNLLATFSSFFFSLHVGCVTRLASRSSYSLPRIKTNYYKKFNIRYSGANVWNDIDDETKKLKRSRFKKKLKTNLLLQYSE